MSLRCKDEKPTWRERASIALMTLGVGLLLALLLGIFVAVPVFLLATPKPRVAEAPAVEEAPVAR